MRKDIHYSSYLKLNQLLNLQCTLSKPLAHDELIFIIIHQIHELAFKLLLHEIKKIKNNFSDNQLHEASATFKRCIMIINALNTQLEVLETMKPTSFLQFRSHLGTSTGYQSSQFHEINQLLLSLRDCFNIVLKFAAKKLHLQSTGTELIIHLYKNHADFANLFEMMIDFDLKMQTWRYSHIKLVERMIGSKTGTGGSNGLQYLLKSTHQKIFTPLWEVRNVL